MTDNELGLLNTPNDTASSEMDNTSTNESENSWLVRCKKNALPFVVVSLLIFTGLIVLASVTAAKKSDTNVENHSGSTSSHKGQGGEIADTCQHLIRWSVGGELCYSVINPYKEPMHEGSNNWNDFIKNETCLECDGHCKTIEDIERGTLKCSNRIINNSCQLRRDMKNSNKDACGGVGKYVCYDNTYGPLCQCRNNKTGDSCDIDFKVLCKCQKTKIKFCEESVPICNNKDEATTQCWKQLNLESKCLCNVTDVTTYSLESLKSDIPDCIKVNSLAQKSTSGSSKIEPLTYWSLLFVCSLPQMLYYLNG